MTKGKFREILWAGIDVGTVAVYVLILAIALVLVGRVYSADFSVHLGQQRLGATFGQQVELSGSRQFTEFSLTHYGPGLWARYLFSLPNEWTGDVTLPDKWKWAEIEFDKGQLSRRFTSQAQRLEVGVPQGMLKPYFAAQWLRADLELTQLGAAVANSTGKSYRTSNTWSLFGGGLRIESWQRPAYAYLDGSLFSGGNHRIETGFRYHNGPSFLGILYRYDRLNLGEITGSSNTWAGEVGVQW